MLLLHFVCILCTSYVLSLYLNEIVLGRLLLLLWIMVLYTFPLIRLWIESDISFVLFLLLISMPSSLGWAQEESSYCSLSSESLFLSCPHFTELYPASKQAEAAGRQTNRRGVNSVINRYFRVLWILINLTLFSSLLFPYPLLSSRYSTDNVCYNNFSHYDSDYAAHPLHIYRWQCVGW